MSARSLRRIAMTLLAGAVLAGCSGAEPEEAPRGRVVLYSSVDDELLRDVVSAYEQESHVRVDVVGDTEATKTTGLVMRLIAEKDAPRADVWWSSEAFGTIHLAEQGVLAPFSSTTGEAEFVGEWPVRLRDSDDRWYAFAQRARVIAYSTSRLDAADAPTSLAELTDPAWKGRVGIARPAFGTTRGHLGALMDQWGRTAFKRWCEALRDNSVRVYDGNATVVRAIAQGEIDVGLTDTDDVWSAQRNDWDVGLVYETPDPHTGDGLWPSHGAMVIPNTVALVRGGPNPDQARRLISYLISARTESRIADSASRNVPVTPVAREMHPELEIPNAWTPDLERAARSIPEALEIWDEVFGP